MSKRHDFDPNGDVCLNCQHYCQHYILRYGNFVPIHYGHCIYPRLKNTAPSVVACQFFVRVEKEEDRAGNTPV